MNLIRRSPQSHFEVPYPTVFRRIVEGFLQHSEEAQRNVRRQGAGQIVALKSISTFCCSANSWQKPLMAAVIPKYCSFAECNSCDKD